MTQPSGTQDNTAQPVTFAEEKLLALLRAETTVEDRPDPDGAMTSDEIRDRLGWGRTRVNSLIRKLQDAGALRLKWIPRTRTDGQAYRAPAWYVVNGRDLMDEVNDGD
jgi:hypothetical protein